ncbi:cobyrinate a,c-diamide synthase [Pseudoalteromonas luteoviolacea]|nr:cobyrinate a,c-diamide synthase [Pseudoalteromonas luteoviolacea]
MINNMRQCPALLVTAPSSGSGKTTITAAIARYFTRQGKVVQVFKVGPDFIDPMILEAASGRPVYQLDLWMVGKAQCQQMLFDAAGQADLILIEGVMGLFDGSPNSADVGLEFGVPILTVIDGSAMAQTFGALVFGLMHYAPQLCFYGVIANKIAGEYHANLVLESIKDPDIKTHYFTRDTALSLPERHLGLMQPSELTDITERLDLVADKITNSDFATLPPEVVFCAPTSSLLEGDEISGALLNKRIIVAKDNAFGFLYHANIKLLERAGAQIVYTSPLHDKRLPEGDALYLPGGYPEVYAQQLSKNMLYIESLKHFVAQDKPILAECGGMLYLLDELETENTHFNMCGVLEGKAAMNTRLSAVGQQSATILANDTNFTVRGHSFHYSSADIALKPIAQSVYYPHKRQGENIYQRSSVLASYMHWYFDSCPAFFIHFFNQTLELQSNE